MVGVGHTRWATHGRPSDANAHPHLRLPGAHRRRAQRHHRKLCRSARAPDRDGPRFQQRDRHRSLAHLIEMHYDGDLEAAVRRTLHDVRGAYALGVISSDDPEHLIFARNGASPLVLGIGDGEMFVASDTPAILPYTRARDHPSRGRDCRRRARRIPPDRLQRRARRARADRHLLGCRLGREERLQTLHAQGDLRAAQRHQGDAGRTHRRGRRRASRRRARGARHRPARAT